MIKLVREPCIDYATALLAAIEELIVDGDRRVWVRYGPQGVIFTESQSTKKCCVSAWGAVSVDVVFIRDGVKGADHKTTTGDVAATAQMIVGFFSDITD